MVTEGVGQRRSRIDVRVRDHERKGGTDADVTQCHHRHGYERSHRDRETGIARLLTRRRYAAVVTNDSLSFFQGFLLLLVVSDYEQLRRIVYNFFIFFLSKIYEGFQAMFELETGSISDEDEAF